MRTGLLIIGLFLCQHSVAMEVTWLKTDWPPHQIASGLHQDYGTFDLLLKQVVAELPALNHKIDVVNLPRLEQAFFQTDKSVCSFGSIYTEERAKSRWYSKAVAVLPGLAVHFRDTTKVQDHQAMNKDGTVEVAKLAQDQKMTGAYQPNRFYPASVMAATQYANFIPHHFTSQVNAAALLLSKRVDYVIEYPERMAFYLKQNQSVAQIQSLLVSGASPYAVSYITCNKSAEGKQIIAHINNALTRLWQTQAYRQAMYSWIDQTYQQRLENAFLTTQRQVLQQAEP